MFTNILAPAAPEPYCERSVDAAVELARRFGAGLTLMHVHGIERPWDHAEFRLTDQELDEIRQVVLGRYALKLSLVPDHRIEVTQGIPHTEILRLARQQGSDLIVMCPYRREVAYQEKLRWGRIGSTMERVSQQARCPVMIVTREGAVGRNSFANLLVATDLSRPAGFAVGFAGQMIRRCGSKLSVLHVLDTDGQAKDMTQEWIARQAAERREKMAEDYGPELGGLDCEYLCWEGQPVVEILKLARTRSMDLIVMAHHTKETDPDQALMGSTMAKVAMNAMCPVISLGHFFEMDQSGPACKT
jgi:nucleotide-binding universal stress UspA family protein